MTVEKLNPQRTVAINRLHEVLKSKEGKYHNNSLLKLAKRIEKEIHLQHTCPGPSLIVYEM